MSAVPHEPGAPDPHDAPPDPVEPESVVDQASEAPPAPAVALTDSHAHLTDPRLAGDARAVLERARAAGVARVLTVSAEIGDFEAVVALADAHEGVLAAVGVHPHEASAFTDAHEAALRRLAAHPKVLAIGETGLDYHYDHSPRDVQREVFRRQLRLAREVGLPVIVHTREAENDTAAILAEERADLIGGVLHCFTGTHRLAELALNLGLCISFSGVVTFTGAEEVREVAGMVPRDRLLVETDSPYLAPMPHRGRRNEPAFVRATAQRVADLRGVALEELAASTTAVFDRVFRVSG
jgi:TatD DNase family protein